MHIFTIKLEVENPAKATDEILEDIDIELSLLCVKLKQIQAKHRILAIEIK